MWMFLGGEKRKEMEGEERKADRRTGSCSEGRALSPLCVSSAAAARKVTERVKGGVQTRLRKGEKPLLHFLLFLSDKITLMLGCISTTTTPVRFVFTQLFARVNFSKTSSRLKLCFKVCFVVLIQVCLAAKT